MRALILALATVLAALLAAAPAGAHGMRTAYLEVTESAPGVAVATLRSTVADPSAAPDFPEGCSVTPAEDGGSPYSRVYAVRCEGALAGREIGVSGLGPLLSEAVVRATLHDGESQSAILTPERPAFVLRGRSSGIGAFVEYVRLGIVHIASGPDHLLFLLALVLHLRRARAVFAAETAFTVSHTLSFSATALGLARVSAPAAEACIALSLVLLAGEVTRRRDMPPSTAAGAASALIFGLVHGLGFAGGLTEIGVPDGAAATALAGFGAGVEIGQVVFLAAALLAVRAASRKVRFERLGLAGGYAIGAAGALWLVQRLWVCFA